MFRKRSWCGSIVTEQMSRLVRRFDLWIADQIWYLVDILARAPLNLYAVLLCNVCFLPDITLKIHHKCIWCYSYNLLSIGEIPTSWRDFFYYIYLSVIIDIFFKLQETFSYLLNLRKNSYYLNSRVYFSPLYIPRVLISGLNYKIFWHVL